MYIWFLVRLVIRIITVFCHWVGKVFRGEGAFYEIGYFYMCIFDVFTFDVVDSYCLCWFLLKDSLSDFIFVCFKIFFYCYFSSLLCWLGFRYLRASLYHRSVFLLNCCSSISTNVSVLPFPVHYSFKALNWRHHDNRYIT